MNKVFTDIAWGEYLYWQSEDKKILKRINELMKDIERNGDQGKGKPEPLKYELKGYWSRNIWRSLTAEKIFNGINGCI